MESPTVVPPYGDVEKIRRVDPTVFWWYPPKTIAIFGGITCGVMFGGITCGGSTLRRIDVTSRIHAKFVGMRRVGRGTDMANGFTRQRAGIAMVDITVMRFVGAYHQNHIT